MNKGKWFCLLAVVLSLGVSFTASTARAEKRNTWFIGGGPTFSLNQMDVQGGAFNNVRAVDDTFHGVGGYFEGGYQFERWGARVRFPIQQTGTIHQRDGANLGSKILYAPSAQGIFKFAKEPIKNKFDPFLAVGTGFSMLSSTTVNYTENGKRVFRAGTILAFDLLSLGLGAHYFFNDNLSLNFDFIWRLSTDITNFAFLGLIGGTSLSTHNFNLGVGYHF